MAPKFSIYKYTYTQWDAYLKERGKRAKSLKYLFFSEALMSNCQTAPISLKYELMLERKWFSIYK